MIEPVKHDKNAAENCRNHEGRLSSYDFSGLAKIQTYNKLFNQLSQFTSILMIPIFEYILLYFRFTSEFFFFIALGLKSGVELCGKGT